MMICLSVGLSVLWDQKHFHAKSFEMILCNANAKKSARGWFYGNWNCTGHKIKQIIKNYCRRKKRSEKKQLSWSKFHARVSISTLCPYEFARIDFGLSYRNMQQQKTLAINQIAIFSHFFNESLMENLFGMQRHH